jgi:hypothetical protein
MMITMMMMKTNRGIVRDNDIFYFYFFYYCCLLLAACRKRKTKSFSQAILRLESISTFSHRSHFITGTEVLVFDTTFLIVI